MRRRAFVAISGLAASLFVVLGGAPLLVPALDELGLLGWPALVAGIVFILIASALGSRWISSLEALNDRDTSTILSLSCLIAACLSLVFVLLPSPFSLIYLVLLLAFSLIVPRNAPTVHNAEASPVGAPAPPIATLNDEKREAVVRDIPATESLGAQLRGMLGRNWVVFGGLLLCVTIQAGVWSDYLITNPGVGDLAPQDFFYSTLGLLLGASATLVAARLLQEATLPLLYLIAPLICVAFLVIIWFFGDWIIDIGLFSFFPFGFSLAVCGILHVTRLSGEVRRGLKPVLVCGSFFTLTLLVFVAWFAIFPLIGWTAGSVVDLILKISFLVAVSVQTIVVAQRRSSITPQTVSHEFKSVRVEISGQLLADICAEISGRFSLSPRESEILLYLAQGRSASYIAERQFVTTSTVKTHTQRIFKKTGVHSKQELLDLVYRPGTEDAQSNRTGKEPRR
ncbi:MAG: helix-turn-helix transcriptional regulator [Coriobacteriales bacterium]|nr:helix-turn-helix transcriptional regulator [Coriobacteriales bacterium]